MEFKSAFFSIIAVSMIIIACGVILDSWSIDYESGVTQDLDEFDKLDEVSAVSTSQKGNVTQSSSETSTDFESETFKSGYGILTNIFSSYDMVMGEDGMIASVMNRFQIARYIWRGLLSLMAFAIIFGLIAIVFRLARRSA